MEKEFTSTLVLTDNETLLINESQGDKKRRCTKVPKRYEDFDDTDMFDEKKDVVSPVSKKQKKIAAAAAATAAAAAASAKMSAPVLNIPCIVKDSDMAKLKHCFVGLRRLPDVDNLATFCMTHQLYKCFCGGASPIGKPVVIEKEQWNPEVTHYNPDLAIKAHYSFERPSEEPAKKKLKEKKPKVKVEQKAVHISEKPKDPVDPVQEPVEKVEKVKKATGLERPKDGLSTLFIEDAPQQRSAELNAIFFYFRSRPNMSRRVVPMPTSAYQRLNRRRADRVREYVSRHETAATEEILKTRIMGAVSYYRKELERQRKLAYKKQVAPVIEVGDDSDDNESVSLLKRTAAKDKEPVPSKRSKLQLEEASTSSESHQDIQVPRIAACYSLNAASVDVTGSGMPSVAAAGSLETDSPNFRSFYNEVVKNMNTLVSKKMQDIDLALQRESKIIPAPNEEILCIIKWTNFLAAFESGYVFIWDVQMKNYNFLAATTTNMMPSVCGAIGVVNTKFAPDPKALPLMARMLMEGKRNEHTCRLAVVMQGRQSYWLVKGFLRHMEGNACTKPTPQTHPLLTKKINVLCSLLVKQRIREHQKKVHVSGGPSPAPSLESESASPRQAKAPSTAPAPASTPASIPEAAEQPALAVDRPPVAKVESSSSAKPKSGHAQGTSPPKANKANVSGIHSNIEFRKVNHNDVEELQIPEKHSDDHRWLVLDLFDDFSHIFVPALGDMISRDRIHSVMEVAVEKKKVVKLQFFQNAPYDAFVTPSSRKKIYFGPLHLDRWPPPVLVLLQSVDGKVMLREVYQRAHSIPVDRQRRSMAFWVLHVNGQVHFEIDVESTAKLEAEQSEARDPIEDLVHIPSQISVEIAKDEGQIPPVVVLDSDEEDEPRSGDSKEMGKPGKAKDACVKDERLPNDTKAEQSRMNFTIQSLGTNRSLQITPTGSSAPVKISVKDGSASRLAGGFMPFISNVPAKNGDQKPTTQLLTPQVQLSTTAVASDSTLSSSSDHPPAAKISRLSLMNSKINESLQELLSNGNTVTPGGITITKLRGQDAKLDGECVKIGSKRSATGTAKLPPKTVLLQPATASTIVKLVPATVSTSNPPEKPRTSLPAGVPDGKLYPIPSTIVRQSLPGNRKVTVKAMAPRQSLPAVVTSDKPMLSASASQSLAAAATSNRTSLPVRIKNVVESPPVRQPLPAKVVSAQPAGEVRPKAVTNSFQKAGPSAAPKPVPVPATVPKAVAATTSNAPPAKQDDKKFCYGFIGAKGLPRYRAKVQGSEFMIKMPEVGVLRFKNFPSAANFLNR